MSLAAVFSPTPGTPGRLSDGSPRRAAYSGYCAGVHAGPLLDAGLVVEGVVADAAPVVEHLDVRVLDQLVGVAVAGDDDDVAPRSRAWVARVAMMSSASNAGELDDRDLEGVDHLADQADLLAQDVGGLRPAGLVVVDDSWRKVGSGRSKATAMWSGWWSFIRLISIEVNPNTALVTWPDAVAMSVGRAKKAR